MDGASGARYALRRNIMQVSLLNLKSLAHTLDVEGFSSEPVLRQCGLQDLMQRPDDGWVPAELFDELMHQVQQHTDDPSFGLIAGKSLALVRYGFLPPLALFSPSLRQVLQDIARFAPLVLNRTEIELDAGSTHGRLLITPVMQGGRSGRFRTEFVAISAVQLLRLAGAQDSDILQVDFPYACPDGQGDRYAASFGPGLRFGQKRCAVDFSASLLDRGLPSHDPSAYLSARTRAENALMALHARSDLAEKVRLWLMDNLASQPTLADAALTLGTTERTLRRHLQQLGTSYQDVVQQCQTMMAESLLSQDQQSLKQVAAALGFSAVPSFHRAFRRWKGMTPQQWRDEHLSRQPCTDTGPAQHP